jgi:hypothetical protein
VRKSFPTLLLAFVAVVLLAGTGGAFAQSNMGNTATSGSTFAVGTVESIASDSVTIKLESGDQLTIMLGDHTVGKQYLLNGSRVRIDYRSNENGQAVAEEIEVGGGEPAVVAAAPVVRYETEKNVPLQETYRAEPAPPVATPRSYTEPDRVVAQTTTRPYDLPATASWMPSLALLGLLSLAGAVTLRIVR